MLTAFKKVALALCCLLISFTLKAQLEITPQTSAQALAQRLVGDGISISNVTISGSPLATGFFRNMGGTQLGLDSGIVLSTGRVLTSGTLYGFNGLQTNFASTTHNTAGDAQLSAIIGNAETNDAIILEFDFVPLGDTVKFNYVFSSEEYPTFTCSDFNDAFAFFISGPGITGAKNIALIPGTNIPVAINSINDGTDPAPQLCNDMGPGSPFTQYFVNNTGSLNFTHNGHTTVLTAVSEVVPCQTYHLKIVIADVFDHIYDSGVFLEAKSLISTPLHIINANPVSNGDPFVVEGCTAGAIQISRSRSLNFPQTINLTFAGTAVNGTDVLTIPSSVVIAAGDSSVTVPITPIADNVAEPLEQLKIYVSYSGCGSVLGFYADSIIINLKDQLSATTVVQGANCTSSTGSIELTVPPNSGATPYQYSINGGAYQSGNSFTNLAPGNYIVNITDSVGCVNSFTTTVGVVNTLTLNAAPADTSICVGASFVPRVTSNASNFSWTPSAGVAQGNTLQPTITPGNLNTQFIVTATEGVCQVKDTISVTVFQGQPANAGPDLSVILGDQVQLQATGAPGATYLWTPSAGLSAANILTPMASPMQTTTYTLTATTTQGCVSSDNVTVTVLSCVDPMNAFSPNGDGLNDFWLVTNNNCFKTARAEVFNRYGGKVFEDPNYANNWNGTFKGKPLPDGTYYYVVTYQLINGKTVYKKGNVTILR